jgi:hypothetical protein
LPPIWVFNLSILSTDPHKEYLRHNIYTFENVLYGFEDLILSEFPADNDLSLRHHPHEALFVLFLELLPVMLDIVVVLEFFFHCFLDLIFTEPLIYLVVDFLYLLFDAGITHNYCFVLGRRETSGSQLFGDL